MTARRLPAPLHPGAHRGRPVTLVVDGRPMAAFEGEPVAVAMIAAGHQVLSRSFRLHRPRGLMCSTGQCGWCECRVDGRPSVRSCLAPSTDGLAVEGEHALRSVRRDLLGTLDLGARWIQPTFYHHRFLRPRRLRKRYLDVIRWFGGRGRLTLPPRAETTGAGRRDVRVLDVDVAVIGGGPAGLLAARSAAASGARVVVLEAEAEVGGPWRWREDPIPGAGPLADLVSALGATGLVEIEAGTTALSMDDRGLHAVGPTAILDIHCRAVVVATGSHERLPLVVGNDRPGVMGARTVEWLIRRHGVVPGTRAVLVGDGPDVEHAAAALLAAGVEIRRRVATDDLVAIQGRAAVSGIRVRANGGVEQVTADLVVVGARTPAADLAVAARSTANAVTVRLAGAAAGQPIVTAEDAAAATEVGRLAMTPAADDAAASPHAAASTEAAAGAAVAAPAGRAMVCFCEDVHAADLRREIGLGYADPELVKRRTGALTGPCQGKYCAIAFRSVVACPDRPAPTTRPPARPVRLGDLLASTGSSDQDGAR